MLWAKIRKQETESSGKAHGVAPESPYVLQAEGLHKTYGLGGPNPVEVLHGVDLAVRAGEFVAIIGQSGSGKSTLLNLIGALDTPTGGRILIDGQSLATADSAKLARLRNATMGFIFQFHYLLEEYSCLENVLVPVSIARGRPRAQEVQWAKELLTRVGLETQMHKRPPQLSGGQQQRCAIVRALVARPKLVLADEPTGNLDSQSGNAVFTLMREMNREMGAAFVMITHDDRLAHAADRILRMEDGVLHATT